MNIWKHRLATAARGLAAALVAGGLGLATLAAHAEDDPPGRVGRLADVKGQVWLLENGQGEWQETGNNRPITTADRIATDRDARAELQIGSTIIRLDQSSDLEVNRLDDDRIELTLHDGAAAVRVRQAEVAREFQMTTPEGRFTPRTAGLYRFDHDDRGSKVGVTQGELDFESADSQLALRPGQRAELWLDPNDRRTHYNWSTPANDAFEQWVRSDDSRDERYAAQRPISPEMTGADDLDRNGQWGSHPEYGNVWTPTTVVAGWAPYRYGRWAWVRPWGWTWVDDASWGFAPFHYGRWVHWGGRWCWAPGSYVRRPVYAPAMVAWVGGSNINVSVHIGGGRPVGWVPLAPREQYYPTYRYSPTYIKQVNVTHVTVINQVRPSRPVMYRNTGVAGGVTMVSSDVLTRRQAIGTATRVKDADVVRVMHNQRGGVTQVAPPTPANASLAPRQVVQAGRRDRDQTPPPPRVQAMREAQADGNKDGKNVNGRPMGTRPQDNDAQAGRPMAPNRPQGRDDDRSPNSPAVAARPQQPGQADNVRDRDNVRERDNNARDNNVRDRDNARPQVARPPLSQPGQRADREPGQQGIPQARRENDVSGFNQPQQQREREREHREVPGFQQQREREQQRETREVPGFQQREREQREVQRPQPQPQPQPQPRAQREERHQVEQHRQPERQERPQQERQERRRDKDNDRRENSLN